MPASAPPSPAAKVPRAALAGGDHNFSSHGVPLLLSSVIAEGIAFLRKVHCAFAAEKYWL